MGRVASKDRDDLPWRPGRGERISQTHTLIGQEKQLSSSCPIRARYLLANQSMSHPYFQVVEQFQDRRTYSVEQEKLDSLSTAFSSLESLREEWQLEDYSLSQTTLEQVFIEFAKQQEEEEKDASSSSTPL